MSTSSSLGGTVRVPRELLQVRGTTLEEYVRNRLMQFVRAFALRLVQLVPQVSPGLLEGIVKETFDILPSPDFGQVPVDQLELQLVFRHDCMALGCNEPQCALCQHNSQRRCSMNFSKKYLVGDKLLAKCSAAIRIEVLDRATGKLFDGELTGVHLELFTLDGAAYDTRFLCDAGRAQLAAAGPGAVDAELDACALLSNNKNQPLLAAHAGGHQDEAGRLIAKIHGGRLVLPDLYLTDSSEALLSGRKPPFRLVVRARHADGRRLAVKHAVSEPFVVATRRVRASHKVEIPAMDDPVSKLEHMGRETVKKLADLQGAAAQQGANLAGLEPEYCRIEKVGDFHALVARAEVDGQLRGQLQTLLKLPKEKWDEAAEHARRAVVPDSRMRAWLTHTGGGGVMGLGLGLLFGCRMGAADIKRPAALLQVVMSPGDGTHQVEVVPQQTQTPAQRDMVRQLLPQAEASWWAPGHAGWTVLPLDTQEFQASPIMPLRFDLSVFQGAASSTLPQAAMGLPQTTAASAAAVAPTAVTSPPSLSGLHHSVLQQLLKAQPAATTTADVPSAQQGWLPAATAVPVLESPFGAAAAAAAMAHAAAAGPAPVPGSSSSEGLNVNRQQVQPPPSIDCINALLQSAIADPAGSSAAGQQPAACAHSAGQTSGSVPGQFHPDLQELELPTAAQLEQMMSQRSLTEDVVAAIAAAYEANQCPPELMDVLNKQMMLDTTAPAAAVGCQLQLAPPLAVGVTVSQPDTACKAATVGSKRTFSAALGEAVPAGTAAASPFSQQPKRDSSSSRSGSMNRKSHVDEAAGVSLAAAADAAVAALQAERKGQVSPGTGPGVGTAAGIMTGGMQQLAGDSGRASVKERSLDLAGLRNMWPSMQLEALMASARSASTTATTSTASAAAAGGSQALAAAAAAVAGAGSSAISDAEVLLDPVPPLDLEQHMHQPVSLGTASSLLAMWDCIQPANSLQPGSGAADINLDLAPSLLAAAGLGSSGAVLPPLPSGSLAGLGDWLGSFKARQGHNGLTGLHSMSLELPGVLLQGANSLELQDTAAVKDTVRGPSGGEKVTAAVRPTGNAAEGSGGDAGAIAAKNTALVQAIPMNEILASAAFRNVQQQ